jgi:hypothetical protein
MATEQAWDDFDALRNSLDFLSAEFGSTLRPAFDKLSDDYTEITADPDRTAAAVVVADIHYYWTAAKLLEMITKYLALRDYLVANGFII